jgi:Ca2+-binding RTX toxin-like protein
MGPRLRAFAIWLPVLMVVDVLTVIGASPANAAVTCMGQPATIVASPGVPVTGTTGNDVIVGTSGPDDITGDAGNDLICAGAGDDTVLGDRGAGSAATGNDTIDGGPGRDLLLSGPGDDTIQGGDGEDTVAPGLGDDTASGGVAGGIDDSKNDELFYVFSPGPVDANLATGVATGEGGDTFDGFEHITGGCFDDTLVGNSEVNVMFGGPGNDKLSGLAGTDSLQGDYGLGPQARAAITGCTGAPGNDILSGGSGTDFINYYGVHPGYLGASSVGVTVDLAQKSAIGNQGDDRITSVDNVSGSDDADRLRGNASGNTFWPEGGDDRINGRGGTGDTVSYSDLETYFHNDVSSGHVDANLSTGIAMVQMMRSSGSTAETDTLDRIEFLAGSSGNDTLTGDGGNNFLTGEAGDDDLFGLGGEDVLNGGTGNDTLSGGDGTRDIGDFFLTHGLSENATFICAELGVPSVNVSDCTGVTPGHAGVSTNSDSDVNDPGDEVDTLTGLEGLEGDSYADVLVGDGASNELYGLGGDDYLLGGDGNDYLAGGTQDGVIRWRSGGNRGDTLIGDAGTDQCSTGEEVDCEGSALIDAHPILVDAQETQIEIDFGDDRTKRTGP